VDQRPNEEIAGRELQKEIAAMPQEEESSLEICAAIQSKKIGHRLTQMTQIEKYASTAVVSYFDFARLCALASLREITS